MGGLQHQRLAHANVKVKIKRQLPLGTGELGNVSQNGAPSFSRIPHN
ncbi:hypothetical protein STRTUCAR8_08513 [Streptomyces turgidiscabies Car8]|uniref:Uncharacterized protein n=1 Tax=Streptomyces turgidiscabies (strain Car8) TaxID=698760 RepID=L7EQI4_STRT8|nr:hypothetical protein STRTUCAR8_08513 [Streptomyces turgidiscabies Car8]